MTPDPATRLHTVARALEQVVIPALPSDQVLAIEQATLCLGHIGMLVEQYRHLAEYDAAGLAAMTGLARELLAGAAGGPETEGAATALRAAVDDGETGAGGTADARERRNVIAAAIDDLLRASAEDGDPGFVASSQRLVLAHGRDQAYRDRAWFRSSGLDPDQASLPSIPELLGSDSS